MAETWICPACGGPNPDGTRFCGHCGQPRSDAAASETGSAAGGHDEAVSSAPPPDERRLVTVLFADISGFTSLAEQLDADPLHEIIAPVVSRLAAVAERYGGFVAKFAGDALLVVFGAPIAQEDHAVRSLVVALEMRDELAASVAALPPQARDLQLHIGVNSGWVVAGMFGAETTEYSVLGEAVNLAQRLESAAPPGEIYVGESTAQLTRGEFELAPLGMLELKGMTKSVRAWQLVAPLTVGGGVPGWGHADRFVGREDELKAASRVFESLLGGRGGALAVIGEPGVGKSRFVEELRRRYPEVRWLDLRCVSYMASVPYGPFVDVVRREFGILRTESSLAGATRIAQGLAGTSLDWASSYFSRLAGVSDEALDEHADIAPAAFRATLHQAFKDWVVALAGAQPVMVLLEDVHWADASTVELAGELATLTGEAAVAVCLTGRPEAEPVAATILPGRSDADQTWVRLSPLTGDEVGSLLELMLGQSAPHDLVEVFAERTGGNPFFMEEMVRSFLDSGVLERRETWTLRSDWKATVPANVEGVLAARIDRLPRPAATVLQIAAVIGRRVQVALLQALAPGGADIEPALRHLVQQAFLEWVPPGPEEAVTFRHALTLEVAYLRQIRRRRQELHRKVAEVGERLYGSGDDVIDFLAGHLYRAEAVPQAIDYLLRAGERAKRLFANREAIDHLTRALELVALLDDDGAARRRELELRAALASPLIAVEGHGSEEVGKLCIRVKELCRELGVQRELFPILFALVGFHLMRGELRLAADAGKSLLSVAEASGERSLALVSSFTHGFTLYCRGDVPAARTHFQHGVDLYRPQRDGSLRFEYAFDPGIACHRALSLVLWLAGNADGAVEEMDVALRLSDEQPHPYGRAAVLLYAAILRQYRGEPTLVLSYAQEAAVVSAENGFPLWSMWAKVLCRWALLQQLDAGLPEQAGRHLAEMIEAVDDYERAGFTLFLPYWLGLLAEAYADAGRVGEGVACITRALSVAERSGERVWEAELHRIRGRLLVALSGDVAEAERSLRWSVAVADRQGLRSLQLRAIVSLVELLVAEGRTDQARHALEQAMSPCTPGRDSRELCEARRLLVEVRGQAAAHPEEPCG